MGKPNLPPITIDVTWNVKQQRFEIYSYDVLNKVQFLMMDITIEDAIEMIKENVIRSLSKLPPLGALDPDEQMGG